MSEEGPTISVENWADSEKEWLASAVNHFGTGQHPWVDVRNVHWCRLDYGIDCMRQAVESDVGEERKIFLREILRKLEHQKSEQ